MRLTVAQKSILVSLQAGDLLKVHRTADGVKAYRLHRLGSPDVAAVSGAVVDSLERAGFVESNMKFPAATFLLTDSGVAAVRQLTGIAQAPAGPRKFD